jgi:hypothetical protein
MGAKMEEDDFFIKWNKMWNYYKGIETQLFKVKIMSLIR